MRVRIQKKQSIEVESAALETPILYHSDPILYHTEMTHVTIKLHHQPRNGESTSAVS